MKKLDLERVWQVMNLLSGREMGLSEQNCDVSFLGYSSNYCGDMVFDRFLNYYSFRIDGDDIVVFNDDKVAWEDYTTNDYSSFPSVLLSFSPEKLESWIETEIELQLARQERDRLAEKENLKQQIELLTKKLDKL